MGGPDSDFNNGDDIAVDTSGNVFVTGMLRGTADFGSFTLTSQGVTDVFIAKLDTAGTFQWATRLGVANDTNIEYSEAGFGMAIDRTGSIYTTGRLFDSTGTGISNFIFVAKHDTNGTVLWLKTMGEASPGVGDGNALALNGAGNVYVTGSFNGDLDFDPGPGTFTLSSTKVKGVAVNRDAFALSLDSGGNFRWAFKVAGNNHDAGKAIAVDGSGNIYLAGDFASTANDFDPGKSTVSLSNAGDSDVFVAKYSSSRSLIWARSMGGPSEDICYAIAVDGSGQVYTTGHFFETADFNPASGTNTLTSAGSRDVFVSQLSSSGNYVWAGRMGGAFQESADDMAPRGSGNVHLTGYFKGQADFDPGAGEYILSSALDTNGNPTVDAFVAKLVRSGGVLSASNPGTGTLSADWIAAIDFVLSEKTSKRKA